jgi:hypothetical protein
MQTYGEIDLHSRNKYNGNIDAKDNRICSERHIEMMAELKTAFKSANGWKIQAGDLMRLGITGELNESCLKFYHEPT